MAPPLSSSQRITFSDKVRPIPDVPRASPWPTLSVSKFLLALEASLLPYVKRVCLGRLGLTVNLPLTLSAPCASWTWLRQQARRFCGKFSSYPTCVRVTLHLPCGTSSKARNIPAGPHAPQPLRNSEFPDGFPSLSGQDAARVRAANVLYGLTGSIILHCFHRGILVSVENPANSWFWLVSGSSCCAPCPR